MITAEAGFQQAVSSLADVSMENNPAHCIVFCILEGVG